MKAMLTKILSVLLVVTITAGVAITGTLAYLTDRDSKANVFTVGDVSIDLEEDFDQGATLIPGVDIEKKPTITNTGKNDAWVWATIAMPKNLASVIQFAGQGTNWADWTGPVDTTIDNEEYVLYTALYNQVLEKGNETTALFETVNLKKTVDIDPNGDWYTVENGTATGLGWNNSDGNPVIHVSAYAIQNEGFASVQDAYAAYNEQWDDDDNVANGSNGNEYGTPAGVAEVATIDELEAALANGDIVFLTADLDLSGKNIDNLPTGSGMNVANGTDVTIHGDGHTITVGHTAFNNNEGNEGVNSGNLTFKDVVFKAATPGSGYAVCTGFDYNDTVTFKNCTFDGLYTGIYMNQNSSGTPSTLVIEDCEYVNTLWGYGIDTYTSMIPYDEQVNVTFEGNTGIAAACERENSWEENVAKVFRPENNAEFNTAINQATSGDAIVLGDGIFIIPDSAQGKTLTIAGSGDTIIATQDDGSYEGCDYSLDGATVTFDNVVINTDSSTYTGYARMKGTYNNCTINGTYTLYGVSEFNGCTFNVSGDVYNIWTWGAEEATFNGCTFNCEGKAVLLYGTANTKLTMTDCVFNDNGDDTVTGKAAIEIGNDYGKSYELIVNNATVNGFAINDKGIDTGTTLWSNKNSMGTDKLNVFVDGVDVY